MPNLLVLLQSLLLAVLPFTCLTHILIVHTPATLETAVFLQQKINSYFFCDDQCGFVDARTHQITKLEDFIDLDIKLIKTFVDVTENRQITDQLMRLSHEMQIFHLICYRKNQNFNRTYSLNILPSYQAEGESIYEFLKFYEFENIFIVHQADKKYSLQLKPLEQLKIKNSFTIRNISLIPQDFGSILKASGATVFILNVDDKASYKILQIAQASQLTSQGYG